MKLSYLLLFGILAYIVTRMNSAYTTMAKEVRELRIKCVGDTKGETSDVALPIVNDINRLSSLLQGLASKY